MKLSRFLIEPLRLHHCLTCCNALGLHFDRNSFMFPASKYRWSCSRLSLPYSSTSSASGGVSTWPWGSLSIARSEFTYHFQAQLRCLGHKVIFREPHSVHVQVRREGQCSVSSRNRCDKRLILSTHTLSVLRCKTGDEC